MNPLSHVRSAVSTGVSTGVSRGTATLGRLASTAAVAVPVGVLVRAGWGLPTQLGAGPGAIAGTAAGSPHFRDGRFHNTVPSSTTDAGSGPSMVRDLLAHRGRGRPTLPVPVVVPHPRATAAPAAELAATWYGHATAVLEVDGARVLVDPVFSERCSPSPA